MSTEQKYSNNQEEIARLHLENEQLKKKLEVEEFHHKTLYKQWNELNTRMLGTEREFDRFRRRNIFYKYAFFSILILLLPAYYLLSHTKEDRIPDATVQTSPDTPKTNQTPVRSDTQVVTKAPPALKESITANTDTAKTANADTATPAVVKPKEKEIVKQDTVRKVIPVTKPVVEVPLDDSGRDSIYWQGWNAYYKKMRNPYRRASEKFTVWLQGWTDGKNDSRKLSAQDSTR